MDSFKIKYMLCFLLLESSFTDKIIEETLLPVTKWTKTKVIMVTINCKEEKEIIKNQKITNYITKGPKTETCGSSNKTKVETNVGERFQKFDLESE